MFVKTISRQSLVHGSIVLLFFVAATFYSSIFGFLSPDSIVYLDMASSFSSGFICSVRSEFFTGFPCGYPILIAFFDFITFSFNLVTASKLTNLFLLISSYLLIASITENLILKTILFLNPITLYINSWTWSENLLFISFFGIIFSLLKIVNQEKSNSVYFLSLLFFLILGCSSRYFFGPVCVMIFLSISLSFGWKMAIKCLPYFIIAGLFFLGYQLINLSYPEYTSWNLSERAVEPFSFLIYKFLENSLQNIVLLLIPSLIFVYFSYSSSKDGYQIFKNSSDKNIIKMLLFCGLGYLSLMFCLRLFYSFDIYDSRLTGFGCLLVFTSLLILILDRYKVSLRFSLKALILLGIISFALHQKHWIILEPLTNGNYQKPIDYYLLKSGTQHMPKSEQE